MDRTVPSDYLIPMGEKIDVKELSTTPPKDAPSGKESKKLLEEHVDEIGELQRKLYAHDRYAILLVFQAMDAAGKDSTIRAVMTGIDPAGCQVFAFKKPSSQELEHDFLWRTTKSLPERGRIGIFNRSYYEEVLVARVHNSVLESQRIPKECLTPTIWEERYESIRDFEKHLARNGTVVIKFWLNVSREEQTKRFLSRINEPEKNWKFSDRDVVEQQHWDSYMECYEKLLEETSRPWAPWYAIPADDKSFMRMTVASIVHQTISDLNLHYPKVSAARRAELKKMADKLK